MPSSSWLLHLPSSLYERRLSYQKVLFIIIILIIIYWRIIQPSEDVYSYCKEPVPRETKIMKPREILQSNGYTLAVRKTIEKIKEGQIDLDPHVVSPFVSVRGIHRIAPNYNLSVCINEKVMCTLTQAIFCYLYDTSCFVSNNRSITKEGWKGRFCENRNEFVGSKAKHSRISKESVTLFMVRDPVEKFLSAYSNKCMLEDAQGDKSCFDCQNGDVLCAVERFHQEIRQYSSRTWQFWPPTFSMLTFHALPSIWRCEIFEEYKNYFFVKYGETAEDERNMWQTILTLFRAHGVEEDKLAYINNAVLSWFIPSNRYFTSRTLGIGDERSERENRNFRKVEE